MQNLWLLVLVLIVSGCVTAEMGRFEKFSAIDARTDGLAFKGEVAFVATVTIFVTRLGEKEQQGTD